MPEEEDVVAKENGQITKDTELMENMTNDYYNKMYRVFRAVPRKATREMNEILTAPYNPGKVKQALFQISPTKPLKSDGFSGIFFDPLEHL